MKNIKVLGIDLAKNVFQLHGTDANGKCVLKKRLNREKLIEFMAQLPVCLIGIEVCGGSLTGQEHLGHIEDWRGLSSSC